jgi:hypothetical protein
MMKRSTTLRRVGVNDGGRHLLFWLWPALLSTGLAFVACNNDGLDDTGGGGGAASGGGAVAGGHQGGGGSSMAGGGASATGGGTAATGGGTAATGGGGSSLGNGVTYYVSPTGNDSNDGKSPATAWQTVAKVNSATFQAGDNLLFEGGQTFTGCLVFLSTQVLSTATNGFVVGSYGAGRFTLKSDCPTVAAPNGGPWSAVVAMNGVSGFVLQDCVISANHTPTARGLWIANTSATEADNITVQNCDISGSYVDDPAQASSEIYITGYPGAGINHLNILNNSIHGADGPMSPDDCGISGYGDGQNIKNIRYAYNEIYDIGGHPNANTGSGMLTNGVDTGIEEHNVVHDLGANNTSCGGPAGVWAYSSNRIVIQYNEAYNIRPTNYTAGCDWDGFDLDGHVTNSIMQYNYAHDNFGTGFLLYIDDPWSGNVVRYNIGQNDGHGVIEGEVAIGGGGDAPDLAIYNNTFYAGPDSISLVMFGMPSGSVNVVFTNNIFFSTNGAHFINTSWSTANGMIKFVNNDFYGPGNGGVYWNHTAYASLADWESAVGLSSAELTVDPQLANPGSGGTLGIGGMGYDPTKLSGYQLKPGSPMVGVGQNMGAAASNYFGNAVPNGSGTGFNIGAD